MTAPREKGNDPERWQRLLDLLDEKLQFGLLDRARKCTSYNFEGDTLLIEPATEDDRRYLTKDHVLSQLQLFAQDATGITKLQLIK